MNIDQLYNKILNESRNPNIFSKYLDDSLDNKVLVFLIYWSKTFNKIDQKNSDYQRLFDHIFNRIETDLREIGYGDMSVNKKMKIIVTKFYSILIDFKDHIEKNKDDKHLLIRKYFPKIREIEDFSAHLDGYLSVDNNNYDDNKSFES